MANIVCKTIYFEKSVTTNTEETLKLEKERAGELGIKNIVVASTTGETVLKASEVFKGYNLVMVTHVTGFTRPTFNNFIPRTVVSLKNNGAKIITTVHSFETLGRVVTRTFGTIQVGRIVLNILRLFGRGKISPGRLFVWQPMQVLYEQMRKPL